MAKYALINYENGFSASTPSTVANHIAEKRETMQQRPQGMAIFPRSRAFLEPLLFAAFEAANFQLEIKGNFDYACL